jgi:hypothetical protein
MAATTPVTGDGSQQDRDQLVEEFADEYPELAAALDLFELDEEVYKEAVDSWLGPTTTQVANSRTV